MPQKPHTEEYAHIALRKGDERGLDFFFHHYYSQLVYHSAGLTRNSDVAKEIASEAFVKLWKRRESIEEWQKVRPLLYRMVYNASVDFIREQKRDLKNSAQLQAVSEAVERPALDSLIETETYLRLYVLLEKLPPRSRQIFQLFYFRKKSIKEIATELGVSVNTVKTQKMRALQTLREHSDYLYIIALVCSFFPQ